MSDNGQATTDAASEQAASAADTTLLSTETQDQSGAPAQTPAADENGGQQQADSKPAGEGEKPGEAKQGEEGKPDGDKKEPIEYDLKAPEGMQLDAEALDEFKGIAKELGLENESAQKLTDLGTKLAAKWEAKQVEAIQAAQAEWAEQSKTDKRFGGDALQENLGIAKKALDTFATPELKQLLDKSGLGNHPEVINAFYNVGKAISEDRFVNGGKAPSNANQPLMKRAANVLYGGNGN